MRIEVHGRYRAGLHELYTNALGATWADSEPHADTYAMPDGSQLLVRWVERASMRPQALLAFDLPDVRPALYALGAMGFYSHVWIERVAVICDGPGLVGYWLRQRSL